MGKFQFLNTSGQLVPAGGLVRVTGIDTSTGYVTIAQPNADNAAGLAVVSDFSVPLNLVGEASFDALCPRLSWDLAGGIPVVGDTLGSQNASFLAKKGNKGFRCLGGSGDDFTNAVKVDSDTVTTTGAPANYKKPVRIATDANVNLATGLVSGTTLNGTFLNTGDRVLVRCQTTLTQNGVYDVPSSGAASRSSDMGTSADLVSAIVPVQEDDPSFSGRAHGKTVWMCNFESTSTLGVDGLTWTLIGGNKSDTGLGNNLGSPVSILPAGTVVQILQFNPPTTGRYRLTASLNGLFNLTASQATEIIMFFRDSTSLAALSVSQTVVSGLAIPAGINFILKGGGSLTTTIQLTKGSPVEIAAFCWTAGANPYFALITYTAAQILTGLLNWECLGEL